MSNRKSWLLNSALLFLTCTSIVVPISIIVNKNKDSQIKRNIF